MSIAKYQSTIKGAATIKLQRHGDNTILHFPQPKTVSLDTGVEEVPLEIRNPLAETTTSGSVVTARRPVLTTTFGYHQPDIWEMLLGQRFAVEQRIIPAMKQVTVPNTLEIPGITIGQLGYGMPADQIDSVAAVKNTWGQSYNLTRVPYASTPGDDEWAQGADFSMKFGPNMVGETATVFAPMLPENVLSLTEEPVGNYRMKALLITTENKVVVLSSESVTPQISGKQIDPQSPDLPVTFYMHSVPGQCGNYKIDWTNLVVAC